MREGIICLEWGGVKGKRDNGFDTLILAQSCAVGVLLTEDSKLLRVKDPGVNIISWKTLVGEMKGEDG